jgi:hypothetical protein
MKTKMKVIRKPKRHSPKRKAPKLLILKPTPKEVHYLADEPELDEFDAQHVWPL